MPLPGHRFVAQDAALLDDGLHYETRIAGQGRIATREANWHDLFNAMVWCRWPALKRALNLRQAKRVACLGPRVRDRAQSALTQFDEGGVIVRVEDLALVEAWDRHDWLGLFHAHGDAWRSGRIAVAAVVGHALMEQSLLPGRHLVGKALLVEGRVDDEGCVSRIAEAIEGGEVLLDPLELRPLPLSGIPGWHAGQDARFHREATCFRPLRPGRVYPPPLGLMGGSDGGSSGDQAAG